MSVYCEQYILTHIEYTTLPKKMIFLDTETNQDKDGNIDKHTLRLAWTCYIYDYSKHKPSNEKWIEWKDCESICMYINNKCKDKEVLHVFAHNAFFDCQVINMFNIMPLYGWTISFWYEKGLTYILSLKNKSRHIKVISTTNYYPFSLRQIGDIVGIKKLDIDFNNVNDNDLSYYCKNDVKILVKAMMEYIRFIDTHDLGRFSMTRASQSFNAFRHKFMLKNILIHKHKEVINLERAAYMGGRTECFKIGKMKGSPFVTLDINSMYPYHMKTKDLPVRLIDYRNDCDINILKRLLEYNCVISHVFVSTSDPIYAVRYNGRIIFPIGDFDCYLCTPGVQHAIQNNHIKKVYETAVYEKHNIFKEYIDYFYNMRLHYKKKGNKIYDNMCKIFMNSLYGKFGQKITKTTINKYNGKEVYHRCKCYNTDNDNVVMETIMMNTRIIQTPIEEIKDTLVAIPAHITEYSRLQLWNIIKTVGVNNVMYCDTDCVKIRKSKMYKLYNMIDNNKLGMLKIEKEVKDFTIYASKDYVEDGKITLKGVPKSGKKITSNIYIYTQFLSQVSHLSKGVSTYFISKYMFKTLSRVYLKGIVGKYGKVKPIKLTKLSFLVGLRYQFLRLKRRLKS